MLRSQARLTGEVNNWKEQRSSQIIIDIRNRSLYFFKEG